MSGIFLLLGSNIDDRLEHLQRACNLLSGEKLHIVRSSSIYETAPWGKTDQQWFLNVALQIETDISAQELLLLCQQVESAIGRVRHEKWAERSIDVDILYYHHEILSSETLQIPHPGIPGRRFTLMPLVEIASEFFHPGLGKTQKQLLDVVEDPLEVTRTEYAISL